MPMPMPTPLLIIYHGQVISRVHALFSCVKHFVRNQNQKLWIVDSEQVGEITPIPIQQFMIYIHKVHYKYIHIIAIKVHFLGKEVTQVK
jgi:hypothetical protein